MLAVVLLSMLAICAAQVPPRCVAPVQFESRRFKEDRMANFTELAKHSHDGINMRTRSIEEVFQGKERDFYDVIKLFNEMKEYKINLRTRNCTVKQLTKPFTPVAIPPDAHFLFEAEVGPSQIPNEHFTSTGWDGTFSDGSKYMVTVTYPDCIPITFDLFDTKTGESFHERYFDVVIGITDPSVFIPPSECMG